MSKIARLQNKTFINLGLNEWGSRDIILNPIGEQIIETGAMIPDSGMSGQKIETLSVGKLFTGTIRSQQITLGITDTRGDVYIAGGTFNATTWTCTNGFMLGLDDSDSNREKFFVGNATNSVDWNVTVANTLTVKGTITASDIHIPDKDITAASFHVESDGDSWWGCTQTNWTADHNNANAYVLSTGVAQFQSIILKGSVAISGIANNANTDISLLTLTHNIVFSATDADTVAWGAGTITFSNGRTFSIDVGNTGNIVARTYIYLDPAVSLTVLQLTTTPATAHGANKTTLAVAVNNSDVTSKAEFITYQGGGYRTLLVDNIAAVSTSTNEFVSNTAQIKNLIVTDAKINTLTVAKLTSGSITSKQIDLTFTDTVGDVYIGCGSYTPATWLCTGGFLLGIDDSDVNKVKFFIGDATTSLDWNVTTADTLTVKGTITASAGTIGGFEIGTDYIRDIANSFGLASTVTVGDDVRFWAGATFANRATAPARITEVGAATFTSVTLSTNVVLSGLQAGSSVDGQYLAAASVASAAANLALRGWTITCAFSSTDLDTVSWGAGSFIASDGTTYAIGAGNTGNMAARTYIYLDIAVSTIALQITTTATTAIGNGKVLIATAINDTNNALFEVFGGVGGLFINGNIIAANSIVANQINVTNLSSIKADLGTITAGNITLDSSGYIRTTGATAFGTGIGIWLGYDTSDYKIRIGDPTTDYLQWDGVAYSESNSASVERNLRKIYKVGNPSAMTSVVGGGSAITIRYASVEMETNGNLAATLYSNAFIDQTKDFAYGGVVKFTQGSDASQGGCFFGIDDGTTTDIVASGAWTKDHCAIYVYGVWNGATYDWKGYLSNGDGTTQTKTEITGITFSNYNSYKLVKTSTAIKCYVNGVLKATNTTNICNDTTGNIKMSIAETGGGVDTQMYFYDNFTFTQSI